MRLIIVFAALVVAIPTIASAHAGNNDSNMIHACIGNISKVARIVGVSGSCISAPRVLAETPAHWAIQGPQGEPGADGASADPPCFDYTNRYVNCNNGTVTDTLTGLIWLQDAGCLGSLDWPGANGAAAALANGQCGLTDGSAPGDWRLPTKDEWAAMNERAVAFGCQSPSLTNDALTGCSSGGGSSFVGVATGAGVAAVYWSSTSFPAPNVAWVTYLFNGSGVFNDFKVLAHSVWPVRDGSR